MNNTLPVEQDDEERKRAVMDYMSGAEGLEVFCREIRELGVTLPEREIWKHATRSQIETAVHATFSLLGGVPGFALWAHKNPGQFYPAYMKLAPAESVLNGIGQIVINTAVPESPLDTITIDPTLGTK